MLKIYTRPLNARSAAAKLILNRLNIPYIEDTSFNTLAGLRTKFPNWADWPCIVQTPEGPYDVNETVIGPLESLQLKEQLIAARDSRRAELADRIRTRLGL
jgi:hypothetical protein